MNSTQRVWVLAVRLAQRREAAGLGEQAIGGRVEPRRDGHRVAMIVGGDVFESEDKHAEMAAHDVTRKLQLELDKLDDNGAIESLLGRSVCT